MTPAERLRKHQRALEKTQRELDRERVKLENQERKLIQDIKKSAKNGQMGPLKIQAKDLVRTRRYGFIFYMVIENIREASAKNGHSPDIYKSSTRCGRNYRPYLYESR